jgi:copper chaperone CopZ
VQFEVEGMTCDGCIGAVERVARKVPGVASAKATLADKKLVIEGTPDPNAVIAAVQRAGYTARPA